MIGKALISPKSIAVLGASNHLNKPGGGLINNLKTSFKGEIFPINHQEKIIQGLKCYNNLKEVPNVDLAIIAIPARLCLENIIELSTHHKTTAYIIISAGFEETGEQGKKEASKLKSFAEQKNLTLIGPNCIGVATLNYKAIFVTPPPKLSKTGVDFATASGALAVFLFEKTARRSISFREVFSVGNSTTIGVEEVLQYWDETYRTNESSRIKIVYTEQIRKPALFFKHVSSLKRKGCWILVANPGASEAGSRAAKSHTGALAENSTITHLLIKKAGAILCSSREELANCAAILSQPLPKGKNIAVITHAGGPAVMLCDHLQNSQLHIPEFDEQTQKQLHTLLNQGSSVINPIDMLATANGIQLQKVIEICQSKNYIDALIVIYGKTGMDNLFDTYDMLAEAVIKSCKPVYCILPSEDSAYNEINHFNNYNISHFPDEILFAKSLALVINTPAYNSTELAKPTETKTRNIPLDEKETWQRLQKVNLPIANYKIINNREDFCKSENMSFPLVAKVLGILHKSDVQGVVFPINSNQELNAACKDLILINGAKGIFIQEYISGTELFLGAKKHPGIGYSIHFGIGGIFVEVIKDIVSTLAPVSNIEAEELIKQLKAQSLLKGYRNQKAINIKLLAQIISRFSKIFEVYPDISEIDLNPLMANGNKIVTVDARIII